MTVQNAIAWVLQAGWDGFVAAGQHMMYSVFSFICELVMVAFVFVILIGVLFHFTGYSSKGGKMITNGILALIIVSIAYMSILGASGPPDISLWFQPPA